MKTRYILFRRDNGVFYTEDTASSEQSSLRTRDETEAKSLLSVKNEAQRQPVLNLHLARAYLTASDPAFVERTWQIVMEQMQSRGKDSSRERYASVFKSPAIDGLRNKKLMETTADDLFAVFKDGKVSINEFLKRLHSFALYLGWIAIPIVAPYLWPEYHPKDRRGITQEEHQNVLAKVVGMPERFAQAALGHNSKAIHRAYTKKVFIIAPSLEDYEKKTATQTAIATLQPALAA